VLYKIFQYVIPLFIFSIVVSCASGPRPFPLKDPLLADTDELPFFPKPEEYEPAPFWEVVDESVLRPITRFFAVDVEKEAANVNALDEVPNSSWFKNRISRTPMSPKEVARGSCEMIDPKGPFEVLGGKPDGLNPGFLVKAPNGKRYFFKFDGDQPERATLRYGGLLDLPLHWVLCSLQSNFVFSAQCPHAR